MSQHGDVTDNLVVMDDKLRELQHELSVLAAVPEPEPPPPPAPTDTSDRTHLPLAAAAADQARTIIAEAQEEAARIVGYAAQRVSAITAQIDDLQRLREDLERSARALVDEYGAALSHVGQAPAPAGPPIAPVESPPQGGEPPASAERPLPGGEPPASRVHPPLW